MKHAKLIGAIGMFLAVMVVLTTGEISSVHSPQTDTATESAPTHCQTIEGQNGSYTNLSSPNVLNADQCLVDNSYELVMQPDGNLVLYDRTITSRRQRAWSSNTAGSGAVQAKMQDDGNLVLYTYSSRPIWASNTSHYKARCQNECTLELTNCGALEITAPPHSFIWRANAKKC